MSEWRPANRRGVEYDKRLDELAASGMEMHGEADFVERLIGDRGVPGRILDAGCGTGRVAVELARRGHDVVGVDADDRMIETAVAKGSDVTFRVGDLSQFELGDDDLYDITLLAGNVMIFVAPGTEGEVVRRCAAALKPGGLFVAGFSLRPGGYTVADHDRDGAAAGMALVARHATWDGDPFDGGDYAVTVFGRR